MFAQALLLMVVIALAPYGTIKFVSGQVHRLRHGVITSLNKKSVGTILLIGDSVKLGNGAKLVVSTKSGPVTFAALPTWQPLLSTLSASDRKAFKALQLAFDAAVIRRGGIEFPGEMPVPCTLFTIVARHGPYKVMADDVVLYNQPTLDQPALAKALLEARDSRHVTWVSVANGNSPVTVPLMPRAEEAALLRALDSAATRRTARDRHLARAQAFAEHGLIEFARFEVDQLAKADARTILGPTGRNVVAVRPPR